MFDHDSLDTYVFSLATSRIAPFLRPDEIGFTKDNTETAQTLSFLKHFTPLTKNKNCKHFGTKTIILFGISYHQGQESWPLPRTPSNRNKIKHKKISCLNGTCVINLQPEKQQCLPNMYLLDKHTITYTRVIIVKSFSVFHLQRWFYIEMKVTQKIKPVTQTPPLAISPNLSCSNYLTVTDFFFPQLAKVSCNI